MSHENEKHEHRHQIHFTVDGEPVEVLSTNADETELKVREVLDDGGFKPAEDYQLVQFIGEGFKNRKEYDNLDEPIKVRNHARFGALSKKPTPVS